MTTSDRIGELKALLSKIEAEIFSIEATQQKRSAAHLFPGRWRKRWVGPRGDGIEHFEVRGLKLKVVGSDVGICCEYDFELISDEKKELRFKQSHPSRRRVFPACEIVLRSDGAGGFSGIETAFGEQVAVWYSLCTEEEFALDRSLLTQERRAALQASAQPEPSEPTSAGAAN